MENEIDIYWAYTGVVLCALWIIGVTVYNIMNFRNPKHSTIEMLGLYALLPIVFGFGPILLYIVIVLGIPVAIFNLIRFGKVFPD